MGDEFERIARIAAVLGEAPAHVEIGIGDDAAVLAIDAGEKLVVTVDAAVEGVHFVRDWLSLEDVGHRATVAAASDVFAMGARPVAAVCAWTLPSGTSEADVDAIARGQREAARELGFAIVGGNLATGPVLSLTTTVLGSTKRPIARRGARPGDRLILAGHVGEAALGLAALRSGRATMAPHAVASWRRPKLAIERARSLAASAHAAVDVSDGLAQDVGHLARASGVAAVIDVRALEKRRRSVVVEEAARLGVDLEPFELGGGEDYALVLAVAEAGDDEAIGWIEEGEGVVLARDGAREEAPRGFRHGG